MEKKICENCGAAVKAGQRFCTACGECLTDALCPEDDTGCAGNHWGESKKEGYLFLKDHAHRALMVKAVRWAVNIADTAVLLLTIAFVIYEIHEAEGYKLSVYVLRYLCSFAGLYMAGAVLAVADWVLNYREGQLQPRWNPQLLLGVVVIEGLLVCAALSPFLLATHMEKAGWAMVIGFGSVWNLIMQFRMSLLCAAGAAVIHWVISRGSVDRGESR